MTADGRYDELAPVRAALIRSARAEADRIRADAAADIEGRLGDARSRADAIRSQAEAEGRHDAAAAGDADIAAAGRAARRLVLAARRRAYEKLRAEARIRVAVLADRQSTRDALRARVREVLGAESSCVAVPGGYVGELAGRRVECTVQALADDMVDRLGCDIEELWR